METQKSAIAVEVLIAYDNLPAGKRAKELCDRLQQQLGSDYEQHPKPWNVAALQNAAVSTAVTDAAAHPDLVIVAVSGDGTLPANLKSWISRRLRQARAEGVVVVAQLHDTIRMEEDITPAYGQLKRLARESHLGFFSEVVDVADAELDDCIRRLHQRVRLGAYAFEAIPEIA